MTPFVLDSRLILLAAGDIARIASALTAQREEGSRLLAEDFRGLESDAFDRGLVRFEQILRRLDRPEGTLARIEAALALAATAQAELDRAFTLAGAVARAWGVPLGEGLSPAHELADRSAIISAILRDLTALGRALDMACAREIAAAAALCTPDAPPPRLSLGDAAGVPAVELDRINLVGAPPEVLALRERFPDAQLLEVGQGTVVAAFGDVDSADAVVTMVAGVGSSDPDGWPGNFERAERLHRATGTATVMWLGYQAPDSIPEALASRPGRVGGERLREFQLALRSRNPTARLVVAAHSYGSVVAGQAAQGPGLAADALVTLGSPGIPENPRLLGEAPRVIGVLGDRDPIGLTGTEALALHGRDPAASASGFERWRVSGDHSGYVDDPVFVEKLRALIEEDAKTPPQARA